MDAGTIITLLLNLFGFSVLGFQLYSYRKYEKMKNDITDNCIT